MLIRVLGCSGSIAAGCRTTAFLVDRHVLIDAGTGVGDLSLDEMVAIDHILVSHSHLDHVLAIGLLADSVARRRQALARGPVTVHALPETLDALRSHVFNGVIWPDFTRLPSRERPTLALSPIAVGQRLELGGRSFEVLPACHVVPAVGFAARADDGAVWAYSGDTGPNPALWQRLNQLELRHLVIETAFADREVGLAKASGHLCPSLLQAELRQLTRPASVYVTHIKPGELDLVRGELEALDPAWQLQTLRAGQVLRIAASGPGAVDGSDADAARHPSTQPGHPR